MSQRGFAKALAAERRRSLLAAQREAERRGEICKTCLQWVAAPSTIDSGRHICTLLNCPRLAKDWCGSWESKEG